jgi:hypothetical protein
MHAPFLQLKRQLIAPEAGEIIGHLLLDANRNLVLASYWFSVSSLYSGSWYLLLVALVFVEKHQLINTVTVVVAINVAL